MAVIRVTHTVKGFDAINYVLSGKAHVADKYVSGRVMAFAGINCTVDGCRQQMNAVWKRYGINRPTRRHRRQIQRLIQSFDPQQLDYRKPTDVAKANSIGCQLAYRLYPHRQSIVITQADNKHHVLHNHILTNMLDFRTGRSMNSQDTNFYNISQISDKIIAQDGLDPTRHKYMVHTTHGLEPKGTQHQTDAEYHIKQSGRYSWVDDLRHRIHTITEQSSSWSDYIRNGQRHDITIEPYRKHKGKPRLDSNGRPIFKSHITYRFTDKYGKHRTARDRKLGHAYGKSYLSKVFDENARLQHERTITNSTVNSNAAISKATSASYSDLALSLQSALPSLTNTDGKQATSNDYLSIAQGRLPIIFNRNQRLTSIDALSYANRRRLSHSKQSVVADYRSAGLSEAQPLIHHQVSQSASEAENSTSMSASVSASTSFSSRADSVNQSNAAWQASLARTVRASASRSASARVSASVRASVAASTATLQSSKASLASAQASIASQSNEVTHLHDSVRKPIDTFNARHYHGKFSISSDRTRSPDGARNYAETRTDNEAVNLFTKNIKSIEWAVKERIHQAYEHFSAWFKAMTGKVLDHFSNRQQLKEKIQQKRRDDVFWRNLRSDANDSIAKESEVSSYNSYAPTPSSGDDGLEK